MSHFSRVFLEESCHGTWIQSPESSEIVDSDLFFKQQVKGFCHDTRLIQPGEIFIALKTANRDGHDFVQEAYQKGAVAAMVERKVDSHCPQLCVGDSLRGFQDIAHACRERFKGIVIGITGSCGKTSTKDLLHSLLGKERTHATKLNWNNLLGVPLTLSQLDSTNHEAGIIEAGMNQPGELRCLARIIAPDIALFTTIGAIHLQGLQNLEGIVAEKIALAHEARGKVIGAGSCWKYQAFRDLGDKMVFIYEAGNLYLRSAKDHYYAVEGDCIIIDGHRPFKMPRILSRGQISNAVLAMITASEMGVSDHEIEKRFQEWKASPLRGEILRHGDTEYYVDCYNAGPPSMSDTLEVFPRFFDARKPRIYVLGEMRELGDAAERLHYEVGKTLKLRKEDRFIGVGPWMQSFIRGMIELGSSSDQIHWVETTAQAKDLLGDWDKSQSVILLKASKSLKLWELLPQEFSSFNTRL